MQLWQYTSAELIGAGEVFPDGISAPEEPMPWDASRIELISDAPGYATAPAKAPGGQANQVLLQREGDEWLCVGHYIDDTIIVFAPARDSGLADILFLRCIEHRDERPITTNFTESGMKLFKRVYESEVKKSEQGRIARP